MKKENPHDLSSSLVRSYMRERLESPRGSYVDSALTFCNTILMVLASLGKPPTTSALCRFALSKDHAASSVHLPWRILFKYSIHK